MGAVCRKLGTAGGESSVQDVQVEVEVDFSSEAMCDADELFMTHRDRDYEDIM